jgi:hypothetical protein
MENSTEYKFKQFFWLLIKLSIVFSCGSFIWFRIASNSTLAFSFFYIKLIENNVFAPINFCLLLFLSFVNWSLEILKWKTLVNSIKKITFTNASVQCLAAFTASLITPNRIGEYGAKALFFEKTHRKKILGLNLIANLYQLFATLFFGVFGLLYLINYQKIIVESETIAFVFIITFALVWLGYYLRNYLHSKMRIFNEYFGRISSEQHYKVATISFLRYVLFSNQFYFLLLIFKIPISYIEAIAAISSLYIISSAVPILSLFDFILKGTIAIFIFGLFRVDTFTILSITTLMWVLNFAIPALIGSYFVLTFKFKIIK